jgi:hypothetical protein
MSAATTAQPAAVAVPLLVYFLYPPEVKSGEEVPG